MKISKARLKEIIKEEVSLYKNEARSRMEATAQIEKILNSLYDNGYSNQDLKELLLQIVEDIDSGFVGEPS